MNIFEATFDMAGDGAVVHLVVGRAFGVIARGQAAVLPGRRHEEVVHRTR
jgi:hypothetical protein